MTRIILILLPIFLMGCRMSSLYPVAGAGVGGAAGSIGGPVSGGLGAVAGASVGEVMKAQDQLKNGTTTFKPEQYAEMISIVKSATGENKGALQQIEDGVYNILKIVGMAILIFVIGVVFYTRLKCNKTLKLLGLKDEDLGRVQRDG